MNRRAVAAFAIVSAITVQAQSASVTGSWSVVANVSGNQSEQTCTFTQKEAALTGSCKGERGTFEVTGKVDGKTVTWQYELDYEGQRLTPVYSGTLESAQKIVGTVDVQGMGMTGEFTANRAN
jgi:hypothetical protein